MPKTMDFIIKNLLLFVIPDLIGNPEAEETNIWIPTFVGMTYTIHAGSFRGDKQS